MRPRPIVPILLVAAAWLGAGPAGVTLRALAMCGHHAAARGPHSGHGAELPLGTPCFCDEMTGVQQVLLAPAAPAPAVAPVLVAGTTRGVPLPRPPAPVPSFLMGPIPPPPNPTA